VALGTALGVPVAWAVPPGLTTMSRPAAAIATRVIPLTAIATDLWPVQIRWIINLSFSG